MAHSHKAQVQGMHAPFPWKLPFTSLDIFYALRQLGRSFVLSTDPMTALLQSQPSRDTRVQHMARHKEYLERNSSRKHRKLQEVSVVHVLSSEPDSQRTDPGQLAKEVLVAAHLYSNARNSQGESPSCAVQHTSCERACRPPWLLRAEHCCDSRPARGRRR